MAWLLQALLSPGMTFLDVGAHIGEFTLIAAKMVGEQGKVIAVEPLPPCVRAIRDNAALNGMRQVEVHEGAISERSGKIGLVSDPQRSSGWIASSADKVDFEAQCWSLDDFLPHAGAKMVHVAKLDASGNELAALQGGVMHLRSGAVRTLAMKLYNPGVVQDRFGYDFHQSLELLQQWGYQLKLIVGNNAFPVVRPEDVDSHFDPLVYCHVLVAQKTNADSFNP
jgi:FkbM family methyltransferase